MEKPPEIKKSIVEQNKKHLSEAGKKGAASTNKRRDLKRMEKDYYQEKRDTELSKEMSDRAEEANENIVPIDDSSKEEE